MAGEQNLEDRIAKGLVLAAHGGGRGNAARGNGIGFGQAGKEGRPPALVAGRLGQVNALKEGADGGRQFFGQMVFSQQLAHLGHGGVIGRSGAGGERVQRAQGHVGQQQAHLGGLRRGHGQPPALDRGKMLAQRIDLADGRARGQQQLMEGDGLIERDLGVQRQVEHGRSAAGDEKEDQRIFFSFFQQRQRGAGRSEGVLVGQRVATLKVAKAPVAGFGQLVAAADAAHALAALHAVQQRIQHGPGGLAQRNHEDALVAGEIDGGRTAAVGHKPVHYVALEANAPVECRCDVAGHHGAFEDFSGRGVHGFQGDVADRGHGSCSFSQPLSACCMGAS